ncbi:type II toxin-antitoxin system HicB family antitoxin [Rubellimicrobium arenae]|uniref:type II toxin-antitoxin system HicB family antitoxin n=1 Tax=Rubellimicrobium arenae TaxID=2817372 RepID=UPI001B30380D|nr:type II toxin-antitoxin system HicB family antitoxin [Rubellimicrobium arenae]
MDYAISLTPDDNDTLLVTCPQLPEVTSYGETEADALTMGRLAVEEALAARLSHFWRIPRPELTDGPKVKVGLQIEIKVRLMWALEAEGITRAELARRLSWHRPQVDRLFHARHATRLDQYEQAFAALGQRASVHVEAA